MDAKKKKGVFHLGRGEPFPRTPSAKERMETLQKFAREQHWVIVGSYVDCAKDKMSG